MPLSTKSIQEGGRDSNPGPPPEPEKPKKQGVKKPVANKKKADVYVATMSGSAEVKGDSYVFVKGVTRVESGHPVLKACPDYFEPVDDHIHLQVEKATAAPGEKRG